MSWVSMHEDNEKCNTTFDAIKELAHQLQSNSDPAYENFRTELRIDERLKEMERKVNDLLNSFPYAEILHDTIDQTDDENKNLLAENTRLRSKIRDLEQKLGSEKSKFRDARLNLICGRECIRLLRKSNRMDKASLIALERMDENFAKLLELCNSL